MVYATDRSKAVDLVVFLYWVALLFFTARRFMLSLNSCFFQLCHLAWRRERAGLYASRTLRTASWQNQLSGMCAQRKQISLGIRTVWSESSLSAWRKIGSLATHWAHSEDSDQTGRMPRLIWVFAGLSCHFVGFVMRRLICFFILYTLLFVFCIFFLVYWVGCGFWLWHSLDFSFHLTL